MTTIPDMQTLLSKVKKMEQGENLDLSSDEDLSIAIMNLISIEEHLFFSAQKTGKQMYIDLLSEVREMRKSLLKRMIKEYEGEVWCISKHLLAASMRLMEVGTKLLGKGDRKGAKELFDKSYQLYSLFWGLNLGVVDMHAGKKSEAKDITLLDEQKKPIVVGKTSIFEHLGVLVKKAVDCCRE